MKTSESMVTLLSLLEVKLYTSDRIILTKQVEDLELLEEFDIHIRTFLLMRNIFNQIGFLKGLLDALKKRTTWVAVLIESKRNLETYM